jgi:formate dehydrogenase major subunit
MTQPLNDIANANVIMICGGNPAENHPGVARFINQAKDRGGIVISVDPRYTRTSSMADIYAPIRPGTDIVFFNAFINYILQHKKYFEPYVKSFTNASYLIKPEFGFKEGYFTGWDPEKKSYNFDTWQYQLGADGKPLTDDTLSDPDCVFQRMIGFFARYTPELVEQVAGMKKDIFLKVVETYSTTGSPDKAGTLLYAMGLTQHTVGVQNIRGFSIVQMLLGNMGIPGGGVNAMRGEANVQGSTDMGLLWGSLPGYLISPTVGGHPNLKTYLEKITVKDSYLENAPKFAVSMLKAWWGDKAQKENDFCFDWLPKWSRPHSYMHMVDDMCQGKLKSLMIWGMNPLCSGPNFAKMAQGLENLDWLVDVDLFETETSIFWKRPGADPKQIKTEVFLLPVASMVEKDGSATNTSRLMQMRYRSVEPIADCKEDSVVLMMLVEELKRLYAADQNAVFPDPIVNLTWNYGGEHHNADEVFKEMNGWDVATKVQVSGFAQLKDDGSTVAGCWIYSGMVPPSGNLAKRRKPEKEGIGLNLEWGWTWPMNRRIIYNRASCDLQGKPWSKEKYLIEWDTVAMKWIGIDVPDFIATKAPSAVDGPFIMLPRGRASLFVPNGALQDGPFPEHYEPMESPVKNSMSPVQNNPQAVTFKNDLDKYATLGDSDFPYICSTYRVAEHYQSGNITRKLTTTVEAAPELFVEMDHELAKEKGIKNGEWVEVASIRGNLKVKAFVTSRIQPFMIEGKKVHFVGMPWNYGFTGIDPGSLAKRISIANVLTPAAGDPNCSIPEYKAFMVNVRRV